MTHTENKGSIPEREQERLLLLLWKAAGAKIAQSRYGEAVTRNNNSQHSLRSVMRIIYKPYRKQLEGKAAGTRLALQLIS